MADIGPAAPGGVIHDIGYRRYVGPRLGRAQIRWVLTLQGVGHAFGLGRSARSRVVPAILVVLMLLPAVVVVAAMVLSGGGEPLIAPSRYAYSLQIVTTLFVAAQAPVLFSRDLRHRTIVLILSRPLTRLDYALARLSALAGAVFLIMALPVLLITVGGLLAGVPAGAGLRELGRALVGLVLLSLLLACVGGLVASLTPRRGVAVATITAILLVASTTVTVVSEILRAERGAHASALDYVSLGSPYRLAEQLQVLIVHAPDPLPPLPAVVHLMVYLVLVVGCLGLLVRRYATVGRG